MRILRLPLLQLVFLACAPAAGTVDVYVIDVEGGKAMLLATPGGRAALVDGGWGGFNDEKYVMVRPSGRDADRIAAAVRAAGVKQIDYFVVTHYDTDHVGGLPRAVASLHMPVLHFVDHGEPETQDVVTLKEYRAYMDTIAGVKARRISVKPGDHILMDGVEIVVLTSATKAIDHPLPGAGAANRLCAGLPARRAGHGENAASVGLSYAFGEFHMVDLADVTRNVEYDLVCPFNLVGAVDLLMVSHHGNDASNSPQLIHALRPRVAILNNGAKKFGRPDAFQAIRSSPGLEDLWQLHYAMDAGEGNNAADRMIANPQKEPDPMSFGSVLGDEAKWIKVSARRDGTFTVTNSRNGFSKTYAAGK